jgi:hypothetical protein
MALPEDDSAHSFGLQLGDVTIKGFIEMSGLEVGQASEFAVTRVLTGDESLNALFKAPNPKNGAVIFFDFEGRPVRRYTLTAAKPKSLRLNAVLSGGTSAVTETLVIAYKKCEIP